MVTLQWLDRLFPDRDRRGLVDGAGRQPAPGSLTTFGSCAAFLLLARKRTADPPDPEGPGMTHDPTS
jgi:hypothetical protein